MKKVLLASVFAFILASCATAPTPQDVDAKVAQVQSYATQICRFVPTATTIIKIFSSGLDGVADAANAICNAVTNRPLADGPGDRTPRVRGIVVKGKFVR